MASTAAAGASADAAGTPPAGVGDPLAELLASLDGADDLDPDARLALLTRIEAEVAEALSGLDGL